MQNVRLAVVLAGLVLLAPRVWAQQGPADLVGRSFDARVIGVVDGDTLDVVVETSRRRIRVRLDGIDTPENGEPFAPQARNLTRVLAFDQQVRVIGKDVDRYQRLVARVSAGSKDLGVSLVSAGLACHFLKHSSDTALAAAESAARSGQLGFWAVGAKQPRCVALNQAPLTVGQIAAAGFSGNANSRVYHSAACKNARCKNCSFKFRTENDAKAAGFRPADDCLKGK